MILKKSDVRDLTKLRSQRNLPASNFLAGLDTTRTTDMQGEASYTEQNRIYSDVC